jgi:hypothetical protein
MSDDSEEVAATDGSATVVNVRAWLQREAVGLNLYKPTDTVIQLARVNPEDKVPTAARVIYGPDQPIVKERLNWRLSTAEVILHSRDRAIIAKYRMAVARDQSGRVILGPMLGELQEQRAC